MKRYWLRLKFLFVIQWKRGRTLGWTHWVTDWRKVWVALVLLEQIVEVARASGTEGQWNTWKAEQ